MEGLNKEADAIFDEWIDTKVKDADVKKYLREHRGSYYSFLAFYLNAIIHRK